jgi:hypothetical protein
MAILKFGHGTTYSFESNPSLVLPEKDITPFGITAGNSIDTTTMRNDTYMTKIPQRLLEGEESTVTVTYDPAYLSDIVALLRDNQLITITFPDGSTWAFYGWVNNFTPDTINETDQPTATITVIPSFETDAGVETAPVYTAA